MRFLFPSCLVVILLCSAGCGGPVSLGMHAVSAGLQWHSEGERKEHETQKRFIEKCYLPGKDPFWLALEDETQKAWVSAYEYMMVAEYLGHPQARAQRSRISQQMTVEQVREAQRLFASHTQENLGSCYELRHSIAK